MRLRKQELGDRNLVGSRVEAVRKQKGMKQKGASCPITGQRR